MNRELIELRMSAIILASRKDRDVIYLAGLAQEALTAYQMKLLMIKSHEQAIRKVDQRIRLCQKDLKKAIAEFDEKNKSEVEG